MKILTNYASWLNTLAATAVILAIHSNAQAQSIIGSGTLAGTPSGGSFDYTLTLNNSSSSTSPVGTFWYAWVPGEFFLPSLPSNIQSPVGWSASTPGDGSAYSIEFTADSPASYLQPGSSLNFTFTSADSPETLNGAADPTYAVGTSLLYAEGAFSSPELQFTVAPVPEPTSLALLGMGTLGAAIVSRRKLFAR